MQEKKWITRETFFRSEHGAGGGGARNEYCFYKIYIEFEQLNWLAILTPKHINFYILKSVRFVVKVNLKLKKNDYFLLYAQNYQTNNSASVFIENPDFFSLTLGSTNQIWASWSNIQNS